MSLDQTDQDSIETVAAPAVIEGPGLITYESPVLAMLELLHVAKFGNETDKNGLVFLNLPYWHRGRLRRLCEVNFKVVHELDVRVRFDKMIFSGRRIGTGVIITKKG